MYLYFYSLQNKSLAFLKNNINDPNRLNGSVYSTYTLIFC